MWPRTYFRTLRIILILELAFWSRVMAIQHWQNQPGRMVAIVTADIFLRKWWMLTFTLSNPHFKIEFYGNISAVLNTIHSQCLCSALEELLWLRSRLRPRLSMDPPTKSISSGYSSQHRYIEYGGYYLTHLVFSFLICLLEYILTDHRVTQGVPISVVVVVVVLHVPG